MLPRPFGLAVSEQPTVYAIMSVQGELDIATTPQFKKGLLELVATAVPAIVVDLTAVDFIDSSGLGAILTGWREITANAGRLVVAAPPRIARVFEITGITLSIPVLGSVEEALAAAGASAVSPNGNRASP